MKKWDDRNPVWNGKDSKDFKKGAILEGVLTSKKEVISSKGTSMLYTLDKGGGKLIDVWGSKKLDDFFKAMPMGIKVEITYLGKQKLQSGNTFHDFDLEYDEVYKEANQDKLEEDIKDVFDGK